MSTLSENEITSEAQQEFLKKSEQLAKDIIREANTLPKKPASEKENLDIIKHLLKRIALHQLTLDKQTKRTNFILILLSIIMAVGAFFTILQYYQN
jgi:hypothetical protein